MLCCALSRYAVLCRCQACAVLCPAVDSCCTVDLSYQGDIANADIAAEAVKELAQLPLEAVTTGSGKRLWMSEYGSGNYAVTDIRAGLDLSTQVHLGGCKRV